MFIRITLIMPASYARPYMVLNRLCMPGTGGLLCISVMLVSPTVDLIALFLHFIMNCILYISSFMWMISLSWLPTHHLLRESLLVSPLSLQWWTKVCCPFILGNAATRTTHSLFLSQTTFSKEILSQAGITSCNLCSTPTYTEPKLYLCNIYSVGFTYIYNVGSFGYVFM